MNQYIISGIQQVGIGVKSVEEAWKWYISNFGMDCPIFREEAEARLMLPYTGGKPRTRHAVLTLNLQSGGGFEIWQYTGRDPVVKKDEIMVGDLGIIACKMKVKNIHEAYEYFRRRGVQISGSILSGPDGKETFFVKDPYGNLFQMVEAVDWFMNEKKMTGGSYGVIIGVTDVGKSSVVYSDILGYDKVIYDKTGIFPDLVSIPGGDRICRRVLLGRTRPFKGPFSRLFGDSMIELLSVTDVKQRKIYEGRYWGDPGFIHLCYDIIGMDNLREYCRNKGFAFTVDSMMSHKGNSFDMGEAAGHFSYIEDPDGTLIEFVETHKIPIIKKIGWYLDLTKRNPEKPLPDWLLKSLRFSKIKFRH